MENSDNSPITVNIMKVPWGFTVALWRDFISFLCYVRFRVQMKRMAFFRETVVRQFDAIVSQMPHKTAIIYNGEQVPFIDLYHRANQIAHWVEESLHLGLDEEKQEGSSSDSVQQHQIGLMLDNSPDFAAFLLGIAKVRATSVLFNTAYQRDTLLNAFAATDCKVVIAERKYLEAIQEIAEQLPDDIKFYLYERSSNCQVDAGEAKYNEANYHEFRGLTKADLIDLTESGLSTVDNLAPVLDYYPKTPVKKYCYKITDTVNYIFTSGTSGGAVKATPTTIIRYFTGYLSHSRAFNITAHDNIYICLPLYHMFAGVLGLGLCFLGGTTLTLADKFSPSKFWKDCKANQCTIAFYIGEVCRYLLAQPTTPEETTHGLRMMQGLGLKKEIWKEFCRRFKIKKIAEVYGSSEGNINLFNLMNKTGSCGFIPYYFGPIGRHCLPIYLIKVDPITLEPIRSKKKGLCKLARPGDVGLVVGQILDGRAYTKFLGYTSEEETAKKVLRDVLKRGDCAFVSGDLMELDLFGNLYFKDRTGDTFRWKGNNVSTTEIDAIATKFLEHRICCVYGVSIPHTDGRAGMIAIQGDSKATADIDLDAFCSYLGRRVPEYAMPKFVRFTSQIETTSTHKLIKYRLREEGFNPQLVGDDRLFYFDKSLNSFQPITQETFQGIQQGLVRF